MEELANEIREMEIREAREIREVERTYAQLAGDLGGSHNQKELADVTLHMKQAVSGIRMSLRDLERLEEGGGNVGRNGQGRNGQGRNSNRESGQIKGILKNKGNAPYCYGSTKNSGKKSKSKKRNSSSKSKLEKLKKDSSKGGLVSPILSLLLVIGFVFAIMMCWRNSVLYKSYSIPLFCI